jgi:hypothetical protein
MLLYESEIKKKLKKLPDVQKKEVLDFADYLLSKYSDSENKQKKQKKTSNPFSELAGFVSIDSTTSKDIDKEVYNL